MRASDLPALVGLSRPTIDPDGTRAVVASTRPDLAADRYVGQLWSVALDASTPPRRISRGIRDSAPRFSPDGLLLGFVRHGATGPGQLYVMPAGGGEPVAVTDTILGTGEWCWSPDSRRIAFTARVPEPGRYGSVEGLDAAAEPPRRITTLKYRANGVGHITDRRSHVFLVEVPDVAAEPVYPTAPSAQEPTPVEVAAVPDARQLTSDDVDYSHLAFSPDGSFLAAVAARHETRDTDLANDVVLLALDETTDPEPRALRVGGDEALSVGAVAFAADGALWFVAHTLGPTGLDFVGRGAALYLLEKGEDTVRRLTDPATTDLGDPDSGITVIGSDALVQERTRGTLRLLRIGRDGRAVAVTPAEIAVASHDAVGGTVVVALTDPSTSGELAVVAEGAPTRLTDFAAALRDAGIAPIEDRQVTARDGHPVHGWLLSPAGEGPHPVILSIHGGPFSQYGMSFFDEAQVYVDAGYAVVMCNPRGSAGYGEEHARAIRQAMGTVDLTDVLDFLEGVLDGDDRLDGDRLGITGGSYGGYLTAWAIAHDHRFRAAIVERGFLDPEQFVGTSDIGGFFGDEYVGTDPELMRSQSPQAVVDRVSTPTLILHSDEDLRCPLPQAERYFAALQRRGVETELLVFPGENHELTRSGRPRHRLQRFEAVLEWWSRYLPVERNG